MRDDTLTESISRTNGYKGEIDLLVELKDEEAARLWYELN